MRLNENDSNKTVEIHVDDELEIILPANLTRGYIWEVSSLNVNMLRLNNTHFIASDKIIGAGGIEVMKFQAITVGENQVELIFHRPFEPNIPPLKTFNLTVIIRNQAIQGIHSGEGETNIT